jgi:hypothetical protein
MLEDGLNKLWSMKLIKFALAAILNVGRSSPPCSNVGGPSLLAMKINMTIPYRSRYPRRRLA